jgi:hypothetical protein
MEKLYKGHRIELLVGLGSAGWDVSLRVFFQKGLVHTLDMFAMNKQFETYAEAIDAGITAARNQVDTNLRNYSNTSNLCARSRQLREQSRILREALRSNINKSITIVDKCLVVYSKTRMSRRSTWRSPLNI